MSPAQGDRSCEMSLWLFKPKALFYHDGHLCDHSGTIWECSRNKDITAVSIDLDEQTALGKKTRAFGTALVALGSLLLETADRLWGWTLGTWLNIGGLALFVIGSPALAPLHPVKSTLRNLALSLDNQSLAVKLRVCPSILLRVR